MLITTHHSRWQECTQALYIYSKPHYALLQSYKTLKKILGSLKITNITHDLHYLFNDEEVAILHHVRFKEWFRPKRTNYKIFASGLI